MFPLYLNFSSFVCIFLLIAKQIGFLHERYDKEKTSCMINVTFLHIVNESDPRHVEHVTPSLSRDDCFQASKENTN